ncbi:hypothetical protein OC846_001343 [Tilletia horrida]|uniref:Zn(2)-C6 fungal-type domain-containing protein n=1 Tax=Tilletia horrida TaxID=155126 RepID=A0AAN6GU74_9BASI|nr:hypothetical protein OC846_001343 [Tilletia horrida]KAK0569050.1 hypothetical protein OC861_001292 [Tilletia horrida]
MAGNNPGSPRGSSPSATEGPASEAAASARPVVSAACLACRAAKRKCDGEKPICSQCVQRGVTADSPPDAGGCLYIASKRGGPRYKGVKGADALIRTEQRKREKEAIAAAKAAGHPPPYSRSSLSGSSATPPSACEPSDNIASDAYPASIPRSGLTTTPGGFHRQTFPPPVLQHSDTADQRHLPIPQGMQQHHFQTHLPLHLHSRHGPRSALDVRPIPSPLSSGTVASSPSASFSGHSASSAGTPQGQESISPALSLLHMSSSSSIPQYDSSSAASSGFVHPSFTTSSPRSHQPPPHLPPPVSGWRSSAASHMSHMPTGHPNTAARTASCPTSATAPSNGPMMPSRIPASVNMSLDASGPMVSYPAVQSSLNASTSLRPNSRMSAPQTVSLASSPSGPSDQPAFFREHNRASADSIYPQPASVRNPAVAAATTAYFPHPVPDIPVPAIYADSVSLVGDLSFANLEMWSKLQHYQLPPSTSHLLPSLSSQTPNIHTDLQSIPAAHPQDVSISPTDLVPQVPYSAQDAQHPPGGLGASAEPSAAALIFADFVKKLEELPKAGIVDALFPLAGSGPQPHGKGSGLTSAESNDGEGESWGSGPGSEGSSVRLRQRTFDTELRVKTLLTDYYQLVYPAAPVMLPPTHLSSLTFHFCEGGPYALLAAISTSVAQHLSDAEAQKTLQEDAATTLAQNLGKSSPSQLTRLEIAANHAATSEMLLTIAEAQLTGLPPSQDAAATDAASPSTTTSGTNIASTPAPRLSVSQIVGLVPEISHRSTAHSFTSSPPDPIVMLIECVAARTLLAQYHYGQGGHRGHRVGYMLALRAWEMAQSIPLGPLNDDRGHLASGGSSPPTSVGGISFAHKVEWGRRVYHTCFSTAVVLATTGGFDPVQPAQEALAALHSRPALGSDDAAWGTLIRGSHYVCRTYQALYDLESLRRGEGGAAVKDAASAHAVRHEIFVRMNNLDLGMTNYCSYDPEWVEGGPGRRPSLGEHTPGSGSSSAVRRAHMLAKRKREEGDEAGRDTIDEVSVDEGAPPVLAIEAEKELARSLKCEGKLMTAGAIIILHRAQAFGNARLFMDEPHCGLPAFNTKDSATCPSDEAGQPPRQDDEALWHRSRVREGSPSESTATPSVTSSGYTAVSGRSSIATQSTALSSVYTVPSVDSSSSSSSTNKDGGKKASVPPTVPSAIPAIMPTMAPAVTVADKLASSDLTGVPAKAFFPPNDRYAGGPFDAKLSLQRCKLAAAVMHETLLRLEQFKGSELAMVPEQRRRLSSVQTMAGSGSPTSSLAGELSSRLQSVYRVLPDDAVAGETTPRLPPYAACSYVLSAYVWLMLSLLALLGTDDREQAARQIKMLRSRARAIHTLLGRMGASWRNARDYRAEVDTLLMANEKLAG